MHIRLSRESFNSLDDPTLLWTCVEPIIVQIRGRSYAVKSEFSATLTEGQRALLMFQVLLGHAAGGVLSFFENFSYLLIHPGFWTELKHGIDYFHNERLRIFFSELEKVYRYRAAAGDSSKPTEALRLKAERLDDVFGEIFAAAISSIARHIRENPSDFVDFADM